MRKDMAKVIVERPRRGRSWAKVAKPGRTRALVDDDGEPLRAAKPSRGEPRTKAHKSKNLNENLSPLKRYLAKNVGRPWDKVYSEISENLKPSSTVQQHVRDHIEDFVAVKARMRAGEVIVPGRFGSDRPLTDGHVMFYVHPRTKLLKKNPHYGTWNSRWRKAKAEAAAERAERMREIDAKTQAHLFDGVWWEVKLGPIGDGREADVVLSAKLTSLAPHELYGKYDVRAVAKRIYSKVEKKKLELS